MTQISKSDYIYSLKHPAWLWLKKHDPSKIPPVSDSLQAIFNQGHEFEKYAEVQFVGGVKIKFDPYNTMARRTKDVIASGAEVVFQPKFGYKDFTCISDIVKFVGDNTVDLYEIKSSTGVRKDHLYDLAFQAMLLRQNGYEVRNIFVIHVDNTYVRHGEIEPAKLTKTVDVTREVAELADFTVENTKIASKIVASKTMPDPSYENLGILGTKSDWKPIYENLFPSVTEALPSGKPEINHDEIKQFLSSFKYPLYFLDYETMMSLVPRFDGQSPYQQIPMQYSLHILHSPDAQLEHKEFLHTNKTNPACLLSTQLIKDIGSEGSVVTWNMFFEKSCNTLLGKFCPEISEAMQAINERVVDLMIPFKSKWYNDPRFEGSASIKNVLPVICPELSYQDLVINKGEQAQTIWMNTVIDGKNSEIREQVFADLRKYCALDTYAMVAIWQTLKESINSPKTAI